MMGSYRRLALASALMAAAGPLAVERMFSTTPQRAAPAEPRQPPERGKQEAARRLRQMQRAAEKRARRAVNGSGDE
jgi:hypothetical protein